MQRTVSTLNLGETEFGGAVNLDKLRQGPGVAFERGIRKRPERSAQPGAASPRGSRRGRSRRDAIADEALLHARRPASPYRALLHLQLQEFRRRRRAWLAWRAAQADLADVYRALRKGREDSKDEPGAADFFFGEMQARKRARSPGTFEGLILRLYRTVATYGLGASRPAVVLLLLVLCGTLMSSNYGFVSPKEAAAGGARRTECEVAASSEWYRDGAAIRFSITSLTPLPPLERPCLTNLGQWQRLGFRFVGPSSLRYLL